MPEIHQLVGVSVSPARAFAAVATAAGVSGWWSKTVRGSVARGKTFDVVFDTAKVRFKTVLLRKPRSVAWECVEDDYAFAGTRVTFTISRRKGETIVRMAHTGFTGKPDFAFAFVSTKWATFMLSLKDYLEKGRGRPFPRDVYVMSQDF